MRGRLNLGSSYHSPPVVTLESSVFFSIYLSLSLSLSLALSLLALHRQYIPSLSQNRPFVRVPSNYSLTGWYRVVFSFGGEGEGRERKPGKEILRRPVYCRGSLAGFASGKRRRSCGKRKAKRGVLPPFPLPIGFFVLYLFFYFFYYNERTERNEL
ncbi:hypothetical protein GGR50DRAFT_643136, partial [Xylaria sp. CBS 124048]